MKVKINVIKFETINGKKNWKMCTKISCLRGTVGRRGIFGCN